MSELRPAQQTALQVLEWLGEDRRVAAGLLADVEGSSPLDVGACVYITEQGQIEGSITGGCVESAVAQEAMDILEQRGAPRLRTYGISDALAGTVGLMCGGTVHVFIHELWAEDHAAIRGALDALVHERPAALVTALDGQGAGRKMLVDETGSTGSLGGPELLDRNAQREARGLIAVGATTIREFGEDGSALGRGLRVHVTTYVAPPQMVIIGAIDYAAAVAQHARALGYRVTIVDPRTSFLDSKRFSASAQTVAKWPDEALADMTLGPRDAIVVCSHDPKLDMPAVTAAVATDAGYIGALGSRKTTEDRNDRLRSMGVTDAELARLHAPCGLDIGASTVEETALAVLAEIVAERAGRPGGRLRDGAGSIRGKSSQPV